MAGRSESWWSPSLASLVTWPPLLPYNLTPQSAASLLDDPDETPRRGSYGSPSCASVNLHASSSGGGYGGHDNSDRHYQYNDPPRKGGLDDARELTELVDRFVKYSHAKQPVVDTAALYRQIAVVVEEGLGWDVETCLLLTACAFGAISMPYMYEALENYSVPSIPAAQYLRAGEYFDAARKRLGLVLGSATVAGAQCFFLAAGYYMTVFRPLAAWRSLNVASGMAKHVFVKLGRVRLRRESGHRGGKVVGEGAGHEGLEEEDDNALKKLYWSCVKTEREVAAELSCSITDLQLFDYEGQSSSLPGPPQHELHGPTEPHIPAPDFSSTAFSIPPPTPEMDCTPSSPAAGIPPTTASEQEQSWYYYLTDISLRKIEMQMDDFFRTASHSQPAQDPPIETRERFHAHILTALDDLDAQIVQHLAQLPGPIALVVDEATGHSHSDLQEYLRLRVLIIRHSLARPALYFVVHGALEGLSGPLREQAVRAAERALEIDAYLMRHGLTTHRHAGTWLGICYCVKAALELFAAAGSARMGLRMPAVWSEGMQYFKTALLYWSAESRDAQMYLEWIFRLEAGFS